MKRDILLVGSARENSIRTKNKMIKPFGKISLFKIYLNKFEQLAEVSNSFNNIIMSVNRNDKNLWRQSKKSMVTTVERNNLSVLSDTTKVSDIHHYLNDFDEEFVMHVNGCFPFLEIQTILKIGQFFKNHNNIKSLSCVKYRYNHFWDVKTKQPINNKENCLTSQLITPIFENVNFIVIYNRKFMLKHDFYWNFTKNHPYLYVVPDNIECLDIDTETDFEICEAVWKQRCDK